MSWTDSQVEVALRSLEQEHVPSSMPRAPLGPFEVGPCKTFAHKYGPSKMLYTEAHMLRRAEALSHGHDMFRWNEEWCRKWDSDWKVRMGPPPSNTKGTGQSPQSGQHEE